MHKWMQVLYLLHMQVYTYSVRELHACMNKTNANYKHSMLLFLPLLSNSIYST